MCKEHDIEGVDVVEMEVRKRVRLRRKKRRKEVVVEDGK